MHLEVSAGLNVPPETAFSAFTDFESMPKWSKGLVSVRVTKREGDVVFFETLESSPTGEVRKVAGSVTLSDNRVDSKTETRFSVVTRSVVFDAAPGGGTTVTAALDIEFKGLWGAVLRSRAKKEKAETSAREELASFARYVEGLGKVGSGLLA